MIGILCHENEKEIVEEFFELFKTPWEFFDLQQNYEVIISTTQEFFDSNAPLVIIYSSKLTQFDNLKNITIEKSSTSHFIQYDEFCLPIYGDIIQFHGEGKPLILNQPGDEIVGIEINESDRKILRVGFDIFNEVAFLLTEGQPIENALIPTLDIHISMLRNWILETGLPLVEIPPIPWGYNFIACLTHDVDFIGIRQHRYDHTFWGFIYRALFVSLLDYFNHKRSLKEVWINWKAVLLLPLVYLGIKEDYWNEFDQYARLENEKRSTFFLIPFKNHPGKKISGYYHAHRAARYDIDDIKDQVHDLAEKGFEIGLHGLDAWLDVEHASKEHDRISNITGQDRVGVRMHWLYFRQDSFSSLEQAGFNYDSTFGYNDAVGYRCGTGQAFKPLGINRLLELPLHIQDTALFYPRRMSLSKTEAWELCQNLVDQTIKYGGVLTILWHMRSLSPERLWADFYNNLLKALQEQKAWFGTANQVVSWFRQKRSVMFKEYKILKNQIELIIQCDGAIKEPYLFLRVYLPKKEGETLVDLKQRYKEIPIMGDEAYKFNLLELEQD